MSDRSHWYRDAVFYELHVRAFADSNEDGIGDFPGLTSRLDYLQDLGVDTLWLLPFYPSPLRDDGYDIADYTDIHPSYGTLADFKRFLREAHARGLRVVTELVLNHTSDQHPWFQRARRAAPGTAARDFYVWSDTPDKYAGARIIFRDFESSNWSWDPVARAYYWHRFYKHQPDLNFDNPDVRKAVLGVVDFWLDVGVDGLRLDAVPYLIEREGTSCENLPETHAFLRDLRAHVDGNFRDRMLLAEANQWPEDAAAYFGAGDECHMAFHFPIMPRLFMAIQMEDRFPIIDILQQTPPIPDSCQWALFLRNHDELTLEMVTDEERDYMYRMFAADPQARVNLGIRRRLAPLLGNNRRKIELMNGLLFSLPGTPVLYYGDELGMGDNIYLGDRNAVRTPMPWSADKNAGFSRGNPQRLFLPVIIDPEYHYEAVNVEAQQNNPSSLLWWMKRLIAISRRHRALGRGSVEFLSPDNRKVLAFIRSHEDETLLVVANLSRFVQHAELDLSKYRGCVPHELIGRTDFPPVGERPYFFTLAPHAFIWFLLRPGERSATVQSYVPRTLDVDGTWRERLTGPRGGPLDEAMPAYLHSRAWCVSDGRRLKSASVADVVELPDADLALAVVRAEYVEGAASTYLLALRRSTAAAGELTLARLRHPDGREETLDDAETSPEMGMAMLDAIAHKRRLRSRKGELVAVPSPVFRRVRGEATIEATPLRRQGLRNVWFVYGDRLILKLCRRLNEGVSPDLEISRFLTETVAYANSPDVAGFIEYRPDRGSPMLVAILQAFVANQGDAWSLALDNLDLFLERIGACRPGSAVAPTGHVLEWAGQAPPAPVVEAAGSFLESARLLGRRTAELHVALASAPEHPDFAPEPFAPMYQRSLYQSMRTLTALVFQQLRSRAGQLPATHAERAQQVLALEPAVLDRFRTIVNLRITAQRIRVHGDFHLGRVIYTGKDFVMLDFEGEPWRPLGERRIKRSPLRDVAAMLRSFEYAAAAALRRDNGGQSHVEPAACWSAWTSAAFVAGYLGVPAAVALLPPNAEHRRQLLDLLLLERAVHEVRAEMNQRPEWTDIPLDAILRLMGARG